MSKMTKTSWKDEEKINTENLWQFAYTRWPEAKFGAGTETNYAASTLVTAAFATFGRTPLASINRHIYQDPTDR